MEYPFKDLLPLDEVLEREGYYKDWTHLDPKVFYSLTQISEYIKTKGFGVDVRLLIAQLAEHFGLKTAQINEIERLFNDVMAELSEDKEFYSLPEIAGARRGYRTLAESLQNLSTNMLNPNLGKLTQIHLSDELLAQIAGNAPVNAVPADESITTRKLSKSSVTFSKLDNSIKSFLEEGRVYEGMKTLINIADLHNNKYWGVGGALTDANYPGQKWYALPQLNVEEGDKINLYNWGTVQGVTLITYDSSGVVTTVRSQSIGYSEDGSRYYIVPVGVVKVGINLLHLDANTYGQPYLQIGNLRLNERFKTLIDGRFESIVRESMSNEVDTIDMFQKGRSPKSFNKKIGIITGGQSNAQGTNTLDQLPEYIQLPMSNIHYVSNITGGAIRDSLSTTDLTNLKWGFDLVTYYHLTQVAGEEIYVIKNARGGTSIDPTGATNMHWTPFYEQLLPTDTSLLLQFENFIRNTIEAQGSNFEIRAMLWHQGEGDRGSLSPVAAENYYSNFKHLIDYCRGIVGNKRLPFIAGTISTSSTEYDEQVDAAIRRINVEDPNFYLVEMKDAELHDPYHFNAEWSEYFGKRAYDYLIESGVVNAEKLNPTQPT